MNQEDGNQLAGAQVVVLVHSGFMVGVNIVDLILVEGCRRAGRTARARYRDVIVDGEISNRCLTVDGVASLGRIDV